MKLNNRLTRISKLINDGANVVDVGCDHALLDIYLKLNKKNINVIASDNKEGPLEKAKENINKYNLEKEIKLVLADGLNSVEDNSDTIVISGMGGLTINKILLNNIEKLSKIKTLILSPSSDAKYVRKVISNLEFYIEDEYIEKDNNKYYIILKCIKGHKNHNNKECNYGPILPYKNDPMVIEYLKQERRKQTLIYKLIPKRCILTRLKKYKKIKILSNIISKK